jgi:hypothetical protein
MSGYPSDGIAGLGHPYWKSDEWKAQRARNEESGRRVNRSLAVWARNERMLQRLRDADALELSAKLEAELKRRGLS